MKSIVKLYNVYHALHLISEKVEQFKYFNRDFHIFDIFSISDIFDIIDIFGIFDITDIFGIFDIIDIFSTFDIIDIFSIFDNME